MGSIDVPSPDSTPAEMEAVNMPTLSADGVTADCGTRSDRNDDHDGRSDDPATATTTGGIKSDAADGDDDGSTITESNHTPDSVRSRTDASAPGNTTAKSGGDDDPLSGAARRRIQSMQRAGFSKDARRKLRRAYDVDANDLLLLAALGEANRAERYRTLYGDDIWAPADDGELFFGDAFTGGARRMPRPLRSGRKPTLDETNHTTMAG